MSTLAQVTQEVTDTIAAGIHPMVSALVHAFIAYLKEPRYQNPLTLQELASLFREFYAHLNSLCIHIYTQLNTNKRQLLRKSALFCGQPDVYDYLLAIANYSTLSIKLVRRSDTKALYQLRVFSYYKLLTIVNTIEKAQYDLFTSRNPGDEFALYDKIFRFDRDDIWAQKLLSEKMRILQRLDMPIGYFFENSSPNEKANLDAFFSLLDPALNIILKKIQNSFRLINDVKTPAAKLKHIVNVQKFLIVLLSALFDNDNSKVNNDVLLPALIYIIIYHCPESESGGSLDLFLNFIFVKNFLNVISPYDVDCSVFTLGSSLSSYDPTAKPRMFRSEKKPSANLYELLNLLQSALAESLDSDFHIHEKWLSSDAQLINLIQNKFFNNGELQYYLTNFEAILYFLMNTTVQEIVPEEFVLPATFANCELVSKPLHKIIEDKKNRDKPQQPPAQPKQDHLPEEESEIIDEELRSNRSRSSSLLNTITSAVSQSVSRSRSNSAALKSPSHSYLRDSYPFGGDFESSIGPGADTYGLGRMKNILQRIGLVSSMLFRSDSPDEDTDVVGPTENNAGDYFRFRRSLSFLGAVSPVNSRTRSGSLESQLGTPNSANRRATLSTKLSTGVSDFMNKLSAVAANSTVQLSESVLPPALLDNQPVNASPPQCNSVSN